MSLLFKKRHFYSHFCPFSRKSKSMLKKVTSVFLKSLLSIFFLNIMNVNLPVTALEKNLLELNLVIVIRPHKKNRRNLKQKPNVQWPSQTSLTLLSHFRSCLAQQKQPTTWISMPSSSAGKVPLRSSRYERLVKPNGILRKSIMWRIHKSYSWLPLYWLLI